jgi:hypothetical protein
MKLSDFTTEYATMLYIIRFILNDGREFLTRPVDSSKVAEIILDMQQFIVEYSLDVFMEYPL